MRAIIRGLEIPLHEIYLDPLGWDHSTVYGTEVLILELDQDDLFAIGQHVLGVAQDAIAEDPTYFKGDFQHLPLPSSSSVFADDPRLITIYLTELDYWHRYMIEGLVERIHALSTQDSPNSYLIQSYRDLIIGEGNIVQLALGITPQQ